MPASRFVVNDQLCFAMYDASRAIVARYREGLHDLGLTYTQYLVLLMLWEEAPQRLAQIGERLHLDSGTLTPLLKRLEQRGLVTRTRCRDDERQLDVDLTEAGRSLRSRAQGVQADVERATGLTGRELAALRAQLVDVAGRLRTDDVADAG